MEYSYWEFSVSWSPTKAEAIITNQHFGGGQEEFTIRIQILSVEIESFLENPHTYGKNTMAELQKVNMQYICVLHCSQNLSSLVC